jgi:HAD superfamily hydrolase (TIGR01509 family)
MALRVSKPVIFDLDGTLVRTQAEFHAPAEAAVLAKYGIAVNPQDISERFSGVHTLEVFKQLAPAHDARMLLGEKWAHMRKLTKTKQIEPMPFAKELVLSLSERGIPIAIASASPLEWIDLCMTRVGLWDYFYEFASADEVARGKPAPDVFLLAAERLKYAPECCIAIEDGRAGVFAALAADMKTYWLTNSEDVIPGAEKIVSLQELIL